MTHQDPADISALVENLNQAQRDAVCAPIGNTLVLAGAGSGKTRVLIHRIAWLIQHERMSPYAILAVTFTNKAAKEMRERLTQALHVSTRGLWIGTFHGLAHRLLRQHWQDARLPEGFQILDNDDQLQVIRRTLKAMSLDEKQWPAKQAQGYINSHKDAGRRPAHLLGQGSLYDQRMTEIYQQYQQACERGGLVDFAELLLRSYELWQQHPDVLAHYRQRFQFLLVDEFQDTNSIQYEWLRLLSDSGKRNPVFVVGDDDQSIYSWRGAQVENLRRFQQDFAPVTLIRLEQNYRSTQMILSAANALISHNQDRLGKDLWTAGNPGEPISLYNAFNETDEARFVVAQIKDWVSKGGRYADCGLLYRSNAQSRILEETLLAARIAYRVYGGLRFFERQEIKDALAYLRLVANRDDDAAFERVVNTPPRGIGERTVEQLRATARESGLSLWQASQRLIVSGALSSRAANSLRQFTESLTRIAQEIREPLPSLTEKVLQTSGLIEYYRAQKDEKSQMRVENLEELVNATRQFAANDEDALAPLNAFLAYTALEAGEQQSDGDGDPTNCVQLMTLHTAKGLEFPVVFLCGLEEQLFPHSLALQDANGLEEERRLCYVGLTRAMQRLYLSYAEVRFLHGSQNYTRPSRFLKEIPAEYVEEVRLRSAAKPVYTPPAFAKFREEETGLRLGQRVLHPKFGEGIILESEGGGESARVQVNFNQHGKKWLMLAYAKLQVL